MYYGIPQSVLARSERGPRRGLGRAGVTRKQSCIGREAQNHVPNGVQYSIRDPGVFMALSGLAATLVPKHDSRPQPYNPQALKQRPVPEFKRQNEKLLYEELLIEELLI